MAKRRSIRLPRQWPEHIKSGVLNAISLASVALAYARGNTTGRRRLTVQLEQAETRGSGQLCPHVRFPIRKVGFERRDT